MILLLYFIIILLLVIIFSRAIKSVSVVFIMLQIISLAAALIVGHDYLINSNAKIFNLIYTAAILTLVITPWIRIRNIKKVYFFNESKLKDLTNFLLIISLFTFIAFAITAVFVISHIVDINQFKYSSGVSVKFYYSLIPINVKVLILANYLYNLSYFLIPLHFYYLGKKKYWLSILCFLGSLNIVLFGLTFFSRATIVSYSLIYMSFLVLIFDTFEYQIKRQVKRFVFIIGVLFTIYFIKITQERFASDKFYKKTIPKEAKIKNTVIYSYYDYLSQWYTNNMNLLNSYKGEKFNGQVSFQPVISLLGQYHIISYNSKDYSKLRKKLWPKNSFSFNGLVAYSVYDFGYILTLVLSIIYYYIVRKLGSKNNEISLLNLFYLVLLIQIPLMAIFYSTTDAILIPLLLFIPIHLYLRTKLLVKH
jgi:hypothetical protein